MTLDELYGEQLFVVDRKHFDARAAPGADVVALDAAHAAKVSAMQACSTVEELAELLGITLS